MNKKMQKLNKTAVAAVLAASGVVVAAPHGTASAEETFKDLTPSNSHYDSIMELFERNIISGFPDGTFKPNANVTRGQAAKMIASILNLKTSNVKNPKFKDVSTKNQFYPYIAVLAERGIINGHIDNTYRPGEVITRSQMAKILVRGFQFAEAQNLSHTFADVTAKNPNRFYIQTLVNLGITKGTSAVAFSPAKPVTRGQLASFLIRAENANVHNASVKEITKVEKIGAVTYIYLNGVKHTFNASLRDMFNTNNTEVLKGAHIEGTIVGTDIRAVNKITFNAIGAANNVLKFDGNGSTYRGAVVITGNHLRFSNWNVAGEVKIAEAEAKSVSNLYKPLTPRTIASLKLASDNIDWGTITPPSEVVPDDNDGLVDIPTNNKPSLPKMKYVNHNIQFVNVTMRTLAIDANRTRITSNNDLANVRVGGYVREFELFADVTELYIESDDNVTFYGQSDIAKLYKNSYKSLNLYADSITNLIAVDNKHGWIDLGDFYYADKVIVPPLSLPHEIFNDFLNDSDKIGDLEDPSGNDIDRNPIENGVVPDQEPPTLLIKNVITDLATANVTMNSNEDGTIYYLVKKENDGEPSIREIMQYTGKMGGHKAVSEGVDTIISIPDLQDKQKYVIYAVAVDEAGNVSQKKSMDFEVLDATPPNIDPFDVVPLPGGTRVEVEMTPDEPGEYYYYYEPRPSLGMNEYTPQEILDYGKTNYRGQGGKGTVTEAGPMSFRITGLEHETDYVVYVVMEDEYGNLMLETKYKEVRTTALDLESPYITSRLTLEEREIYEFEFSVSEALDPVAANNIDNYELSGTAILNVDGQPTTIKPDKVTYIEGQKKVRIRIPSATALVNGDTIEVKVLPGVTDLAENAFESQPVGNNTIARNVASYVHEDTFKPTIKDLKIDISPTGEIGEFTFNANKAGTYYYMILPDDFDFTDITNRDFYNDFTDTKTPGVSFDEALVKVGANGDKPVYVGDQPLIHLDIPLEEANPFKSYSLHIIMKDRSGNISNKIDIPVIQDKKAPFISNLNVKPYLESKIVQGYDNGVRFEFDSSEIGTLYYYAVPKKVVDPSTNSLEPNPEIGRLQSILNNNEIAFNNAADNLRISSNPGVRSLVSEITGGVWTKHPASLVKGANTINLTGGFAKHEEYEFYFAAEDKFKNLTIFSQSSTDPTTYSKEILNDDVYTDGHYPRVHNIFKRALPFEFRNGILEVVNWDTSGGATAVGDGKIKYDIDKTFKMTFSEALTIATTTAPTGSVKLAENSDAILPIIKDYINSLFVGGSNEVEDIEWQNLTGRKTYEERNLIINFKNPLTVDTTVDVTNSMLESVTDLAGNKFSADIFSTSIIDFGYESSYKSVIGSGNLRSATLQYDEGVTLPSPTSIWTSRYVNVVSEIFANTSYDAYAYYVATFSNFTSLTDEDVNMIVNALNDPNSPKINDSRFVIYGKREMPEGTSGSLPAEFDAFNPYDTNDNSVNSAFTTEFQEGQNLFIFTRDKYGNIVWTTDENDPTKRYIKINRP